MSLPTPSSTFTIPSLHDDLELDCRIYYPRYHEHHKGFFGRAFAIVAHPYAPLGGCFDDPIVALVGSTLLQCGITVGTFNFRGAGGSGGRTSWTGRAELGDYVSFYGFMLCCISALKPEAEAESADEQEQSSAKPLLILAGYSYGSLIASCLPGKEMVRSVFIDIAPDSTEAEIQSRAAKTGRDLRAYFSMSRSGVIGRGRTSLRVSDADTSPTKRGIAMGGYDSEVAGRRISRESSRKSIDGERVRRSLDRTRQRIRAHLSTEQTNYVSASLHSEQGGVGLSDPRLAYLLISPLLGPVSMLTTLFSKPSFERTDRITGRVLAKDTQPQDDKLAAHPTCLIFGNKDVFTPAKKLQRWAEVLRQKGPTTDQETISSYEVDGAGHFWIENGATNALQTKLKTWLGVLRSNRPPGLGSLANA